MWRSVKCGKCGECARVWLRRVECGSGVKVCRVWKCGECRAVRMKQSSVGSVGEVQNMQSVEVSVGVKCGYPDHWDNVGGWGAYNDDADETDPCQNRPTVQRKNARVRESCAC